MAGSQEAQSKDNFDEDEYRNKLVEQGYTEDAAKERATKRKEELANKNESESDFEYVMKLETIVTTDDSVIVAGIATTETMDHDGEIVDLESVKTVWNEYMENPVIRYMHGKDPRNPEAIGVVIPEYTDSNGHTLKTEFTDKGPFIVAKISNAPDTESIRTKIKEGVLKGFSIGGRAQRIKEFSHRLGKNVNRIITKRINEVSIVDLPANPDSIFNVIKSCTGASCHCNLEKTEEGVIPKDWWDNCMSTAKGIKGMTDPAAFCGWMYHHGKENFEAQRRAIGKSESNDIEKGETIELSGNINTQEVIKMDVSENEVGFNAGDVTLEVPELTEYIKQVVTDMVEKQEQTEKMERVDALIAENAALTQKIAKMEADAAASIEKAEADAVPEKPVVDESVAKIEALEAEIAKIKEAPLYKSVQEGETVEKTESTSHLGSIISAHYGGA